MYTEQGKKVWLSANICNKSYDSFTVSGFVQTRLILTLQHFMHLIGRLCILHVVLRWVPAHWGLGEIDGLLVPPGKASKLLSDHLITGKSLKSEPAQESGLVKTSIHMNRIGLLRWLYVY